MNTNLKNLYLGIALAVSTALVGHAQTGPSTDPLPVTQHSEAVKAVRTARSNKAGVTPDLATTSYSSYCSYHFYGSGTIINCSDPGINANSRVVASISEYATSAESDRFIGAAKMSIHNVSPYNGGFTAWVDVEWSYPLNVRVDYFVEP